MKLFTIFFYLTGLLSLLSFKEYFGLNSMGLFGNAAFLVFPILLIHGPLISLAGLIYAYKENDIKLLTYYTVFVTIPVTIICCSAVWNAYN